MIDSKVKMEQHLKIQAEQTLPIWAALRNKGTAYQQSPEGERIGLHMSAAASLASDIGGGELGEILARMFAAVALGYPGELVAMHARGLVNVLVRNAADLNATSIENGEAVAVLFKEH